MSLSQPVLVPVLAILPERLHTSTSNVEWLLTSTLLAGAVAVPLFVRMGDLFGKRRLLIAALAALAAGSLLDALTSNVALLIVGRAMHRASLAAIPLGISLLTALLPRERVRSGDRADQRDARAGRRARPPDFPDRRADRRAGRSQNRVRAISTAIAAEGRLDRR